MKKRIITMFIREAQKFRQAILPKRQQKCRIVKINNSLRIERIILEIKASQRVQGPQIQVTVLPPKNRPYIHHCLYHDCNSMHCHWSHDSS